MCSPFLCLFLDIYWHCSKIISAHTQKVGICNLVDLKMENQFCTKWNSAEFNNDMLIALHKGRISDFETNVKY